MKKKYLGSFVYWLCSCGKLIETHASTLSLAINQHVKMHKAKGEGHGEIATYYHGLPEIIRRRIALMEKPTTAAAKKEPQP